MSLYEINNRFWEWAEMHDLSANACCLFWAVVQCLNRSGWQSELPIPLSKLLAMTHLSRAALYRARAELMQAGLIGVKDNASRKAASLYGLTLPAPGWAEEAESAPDMSQKAYGEAAGEAGPGPSQDASPDAFQGLSQEASQGPFQDASQGLSQHASRDASQNSGQKREHIKNKTKTKTKTKTLSPAARQRFGEFWDLYPRKSGRREAERAWADTVGEDGELYQAVMEALSKQVFWEQWQRDGGRFIPYPARWLEQRLWEDQAVCLPRKPSKYDNVIINGEPAWMLEREPPRRHSKYDNVKIN